MGSATNGARSETYVDSKIVFFCGRRILLYSKMSNNIPDKIKPFGRLQDFGAGHLKHYQTFLYGYGLRPFGTLRDFLLGHYKTL